MAARTKRAISGPKATPHLTPRRQPVAEDAPPVHLRKRTGGVPTRKDGVGEWSTEERVAGDGHGTALTPRINPSTTPSTSLVTLPEPTDIMFAHGKDPLPAWVEEIRPHQVDCATEIAEGFDAGNAVMWLDGPTGAGKTLIAELVRRIMRTKALYVCSDKSLQDQFSRDFPYAKVLKGRANYPVLSGPPFVTCADCMKSGEPPTCKWCPDVWKCPYTAAKDKALSSQLAVINTSYLLYEGNYVGAFSENPFVIADECDLLERELLGFSEFSVTEKLLDDLELNAPKKGSHRGTIVNWVRDDLTPALLAEMDRGPRPDEDEVRFYRRQRSIGTLWQDSQDIIHNYDESWVRDYSDDRPLVLKPITVERFGRRLLWRHGEQWLCMSATIVSAEELSSSLGLEYLGEGEGEDGAASYEEGVKWGLVRAPMTFPVNHRPVYVCKQADMTRKGQEAGGIMDLMAGIKRIVDGYPDMRVLIHSHAYKLTREIVGYLQGEFHPDRKRLIVSYTKAAERDGAMAKYLSTPGAIIVAPSFDRGVDFKGDKCRVQIVAKMPNPYLGDNQVNARLNSHGGKTWYAAQTARTLVQSTGRGVRSIDDWCLTYILDAGFFTFKRKNKALLPEWWQEAVQVVKPGMLGQQPIPV